MNLINKSLIIWLAAFSISFSTQANDCSHETCPMTKESFRASIKRLKTLYPSIRFFSKWSDNRLRASAQFRRIFLSGGFARKEGINLGGFITVACHEVGHALLSLSEGEADYFSTSDCMKRYFKEDQSVDIVASYPQVDPEVQFQCEQTYSDREKIAQCIRIGLSSMNAANLGRIRCFDRVEELRKKVVDSRRSSFPVSNFYLRCLRTDPQVSSERFSMNELLAIIDSVSFTLSQEINYSIVDQRVVRKTYSSHNSPACRMQTLRHGNLLIEKPACWFKN